MLYEQAKHWNSKERNEKLYIKSKVIEQEIQEKISTETKQTTKNLEPGRNRRHPSGGGAYAWSTRKTQV